MATQGESAVARGHLSREFGQVIVYSRCGIILFAIGCFHVSLPSLGQVVDASTLADKTVVGYQGWFMAPGDGNPASVGWRHWRSESGAAPGGTGGVAGTQYSADGVAAGPVAARRKLRLLHPAVERHIRVAADVPGRGVGRVARPGRGADGAFRRPPSRPRPRVRRGPPPGPAGPRYWAPT